LTHRYNKSVIGFTIISFILANLGLNSVINMSVPVLSIIYPVAITMIILILLARFIPTKPIAQQIIIGICCAIGLVGIKRASKIKIIIVMATG
jgi:LIVCS family branched-chain amino acid:cation transporter